MIYIFGICERCKEPIELKLKYVAMDKNADITTQLVLQHRPKAIGSACVCGGRIRVLCVTEADDEDIRTLLPIEILQALYESGMSLRELATLVSRSHTRIRQLLMKSDRIVMTGLRRVGRPSKSSRMKVQSEDIIKTTS